MKNSKIEQIINEELNKVLLEAKKKDIYEDLKYDVDMICLRHKINPSINIADDGTFQLYFDADERNEIVKEAIEQLTKLGLKHECFFGTHHIFKINFSQ